MFRRSASAELPIPYYDYQLLPVNVRPQTQRTNAQPLKWASTSRPTGCYRPYITHQLTLLLTMTLLTLTDPRSLTLKPNLTLFLHINYAVRNRK